MTTETISRETREQTARRSGRHPVLARIAYAALFTVALPVLLFFWARETAQWVPLSALHSVPAGIALGTAGAALMISGTWALYEYGRGLPMNAFPPEKLVERGVYSLVSHPIYVGFVLAVLGASLFTGSASGLWLVTPLTALGCVALVQGYERHDMKQRLGVPAARSALALPSAGGQAPLLKERLTVYVLVLVPWLVLFGLIAGLGEPPDAISTYLPGEDDWPVLQWTESIYVSVYIAVVVAPFLARNGSSLRRFAVRGLLGSAIVFPLYLVLPFVCVQRAFFPTSMLGELLLFERSLDSSREAFPSFHVIWAAFSAGLFAERWPRARFLVGAWLAAVAVSCVTTGMHSVADVVAGSLMAFAIVHAHRIWSSLRCGAERVANSWREWRIGRLRIINHGGYAAVGTLLGSMILGGAAGPNSSLAIVLSVACTLVASATWAQLVEGSPQLLRPYGFYGGLLGAIVGSLLSPVVGEPTWLMLAAFSLAGPWVQSFGRLRCLVQGCCHGAPAPAEIGIRYVHPRSRVTRLSQFGGVPIHPTPVYSILWNVVMALVITRLWSLHAALHLIAGLYLILSGLGRFVEEAYRGEPQTPVYWKLRFYQWVAIVSVLAGILITIFGRSGPAPTPQLAAIPMITAVVLGLAIGAALGVDFPDSNRRFSRLA